MPSVSAMSITRLKRSLPSCVWSWVCPEMLTGLRPRSASLRLDAVELGIGDGIRVDVLEPALDRADLAVAVARLGKPLQRRIDRQRGKDDRRTQNQIVWHLVDSVGALLDFEDKASK